MLLVFFLSFIFFSLDFLLKKIIQANFTFNTPYPLIGNIVNLRIVHNTGAAFGVLKGKTSFLIFAGLIFIFVFMFWIFKEEYTLTKKIFLSMILGGAFCNLCDRIFLGYVIDYIDLGWWPVFNLSDSFITLGCIFFFLTYLLKNKKQVVS